MSSSNKMVAHRPNSVVYILPNLFTTAALMAGFTSILLALDGNFSRAAILIFVSMVMDGLDGRVARWTNTQSSFGEQYDSLADVISFGVAPALLVYLWSLKGLGEASKMAGNLGWFAAFLYLACTALRLARFNVQIGKVDKRYFVGLPSPSAAAIVVGFVWVGSSLEIPGHKLDYVALFLTVYAGLMMVCNFLFYSFKTIVFKQVPFYFLTLIIVYAALLLSTPSKVLFLTALVYGFSGPIHWITRRYRRYRRYQKIMHARHHDEQ